MAQYKTKEQVLKHIASGKKFNTKPFERFHKDRDCIIAYLKRGSPFHLLDDKFMNDREVMKLCFKTGCVSLYRFVVKSKLMNDNEFIEEVIKYRPFIAEYLPLELLDDYEIAQAFKIGCFRTPSTNLMKLFSEEIRNTKELMLEFIELDFSAIEDVSSTLKDDRDFVAAAIRINPNCIQYASDRLKADKNLVILAFNMADEQDIKLSLQTFSHSLRQDRQVAEFAVAHNPTNIRYLSKELKTDIDMQHHAFLFAKDDGVTNHLQILLNMEGIDPLLYLQKCILERNLSLSIPEKKEEEKIKVKI